MHNHIKQTPCNHKFKFCSECDVVYCDQCHEEWKKETVNVPWTTTTTDTPNWGEFKTIYGGTEHTGCMWDGVPPGKAMGMVCPCPKCNTVTM